VTVSGASPITRRSVPRSMSADFGVDWPFPTDPCPLPRALTEPQQGMTAALDENLLIENSLA
jgi:hypothetical protein